MNENKKMTAPSPSAPTDGGQSNIKTNNIITQNTQIYNQKTLDFPNYIKEKGLFCCWKYEERDGRKTKVPYNPCTGQMAKSNDKTSFTDYKTAVNVNGYDGIGIGIFNGICAIDLDHCISETGELSNTAYEIVNLMHSYTEFSPSRKGLHILFCANGFVYDKSKYYIMNHKAGIEVYVAGATNKYVTVTGECCENYEFGDRTEELKQLLKKYMCRPETNARNAINAVNSDLSENELINLAKSSRNGTVFSSLWNGSTNGYLSHSEADMALCSQLAFWTGKDEVLMDKLFRQSGLMREKWDRKQSGTTYGAITIQKAIEHCKDVYTPRQPQIDKQETQQTIGFAPLIPLTPQWNELPRFPVDALPVTVKNYVNAVAEHSQTSPDMAAVISLGVLAVCLQGKYKVEGTEGYYEPLSLYTVVIASPGERKSSVMRDMTEFLYEYEQEYNKSRSDEIRANNLKRETLERQIAGIQRQLERKESKDLDYELQYLKSELEQTPELKPVRFFADDCSSEALTSLMAANGGTFSVISTEGGIFDIMAGRYSNKANIDIWLKGHCGDAVYVDRMTREAECIMHPALSAILSIQPSVLDEIMSNTTMSGRGLIARFLYSSPPSRIGNRVFRTPAIPPEIKSAYRNMIFKLMSIQNLEIQTLKLSDKASMVMADYFDEHERFLVGEGQAISDWASKYIGAILRIAGLLHAVDMLDNENEISDKIISRAIQIGKYFLAHSSYAYSMMGTDLSIQKAKFVIAKLKKKGTKQIKRSELFQMCRGKFFKKTEEIFPTLEILEGHGYIRIEQPERQSAGRPADIRIFVNPVI